MPNKRKDGKKLVSFWATKEEKRALEEAMELAGFATMSDYLKWIAANPPVEDDDLGMDYGGGNDDGES